MGNQSVSLPAPAANGSGAPVDVSTFGATKTFVITGTWDRNPTVTIEACNSSVAGAAGWRPIRSFQGAGRLTIDLAIRHVRITVANYTGGQAPVCSLGGTDDGTDFATVAGMPSGNGNSTALDVTALGLFKTVDIGGTFTGVANVEISTDGGTTYSTYLSLNGQTALATQVIAADFIRVQRSGVPGVGAPGLPVVNVGACTQGGGSGSAFITSVTSQFSVTAGELALETNPLVVAALVSDTVVEATTSLQFVSGVHTTADLQVSTYADGTAPQLQQVDGDGSMRITSEADFAVTAADDVSIQAQGDAALNSLGTGAVTLGTSNGNIVANAQGDIGLIASGNCNVTADNLEVTGSLGVAGAEVDIDTSGVNGVNFNVIGGGDFAVTVTSGGDINLQTGSGGSATFQAADLVQINALALNGEIRLQSVELGFYSVTPVVRQTITGSRGGNAALASLLTALALVGLIIDSTTA